MHGKKCTGNELYSTNLFFCDEQGPCASHELVSELRLGLCCLDLTNNILSTSRNATSPSEGSFLYVFLGEELQTKEKTENLYLESAITGTCNTRSGLYDFESESLDEICFFEGSWGRGWEVEGGRGGVEASGEPFGGTGWGKEGWGEGGRCCN